MSFNMISYLLLSNNYNNTKHIGNMNKSECQSSCDNANGHIPVLIGLNDTQEFKNLVELAKLKRAKAFNIFINGQYDFTSLSWKYGNSKLISTNDWLRVDGVFPSWAGQSSPAIL